MIEAYADKVIVKLDKCAEQTDGGIVLPEIFQDEENKLKQGVARSGLVVSVGEGKLSDKGVFIETSIEIDDRVVFPSYAGSDVTEDGIDYCILTEDMILAKEV